MCARYHWTVKPYWLIVAHIVLMQGVLSYLVMGNWAKGHWWLEEKATLLAKLVMLWQVVGCWVQYVTIVENYSPEGDTVWENYSRYAYLICNSSAAQTLIQLLAQVTATNLFGEKLEVEGLELLLDLVEKVEKDAPIPICPSCLPTCCIRRPENGMSNFERRHQRRCPTSPYHRA